MLCWWSCGDMNIMKNQSVQQHVFSVAEGRMIPKSIQPKGLMNGSFLSTLTEILESNVLWCWSCKWPLKSIWCYKSLNLAQLKSTGLHYKRYRLLTSETIPVCTAPPDHSATITRRSIFLNEMDKVGHLLSKWVKMRYGAHIFAETCLHQASCVFHH